ncbi:aryl-alcohol dehydrogenase [Irpex rosettiformis]|uniref:Aryl-alcohol dehydrogenase n=1 Tax=Irpex rosettiformis TaxID=378272 RepID=A0ACB8UI48_9APHY|nr:aryl-alcohol dehydrogenase [Irpex rosettiformis]
MASTTKRKISYVRLGNSGLKVSKLIFGTMQYGNKNWANWVIDDENVAVEHIKYAYEQGITTFDTADVYSNGLSEIILGKAIKKLNLPRDEIVILTKTYSVAARNTDGPNVFASGVNPDEAGYANRWGLSRKHIFESIKGSLERLQLDYVDILQCHRFDYNTPIEETMQALHDVVKAGYARYIGMSSCYAYQFHAMQNYSITHNLTPFISMQNHYNLLYREEEREMYPTLKMFGVGSIPWSPIARGLLTRPLSKQSLRGSTDWFINRYHQGATDAIINRVEEVASKRGVSTAQVATAWVLSKPGVSAPIVGTTNLEHLKDILNAVDLKLTEEEIKYLEDAYVPVKVIGHL